MELNPDPNFWPTSAMMSEPRLPCGRMVRMLSSKLMRNARASAPNERATATSATTRRLRMQSRMSTSEPKLWR